MLFAAGLGSRLRPLTNDKPKALVEVGGKSLLEWNILKLKTAGINSIILNVHHFAEKIIGFLQEKNNFGINISVSDETDCLLETGGGLKKAAWFFEGESHFIVANADILSNINIQKFEAFHLQSNADATMAVRKRDTSRYLIFNQQDQLIGWKNIKTNEKRWIASPSKIGKSLAFSGIQILSHTFLKQIEGDGAFSIIENYLQLGTKLKVVGFDHSDDLWVDVGKPESIPIAEKLIPELFQNIR